MGALFSTPIPVEIKVVGEEEAPEPDMELPGDLEDKLSLPSALADNEAPSIAPPTGSAAPRFAPADPSLSLEEQLEIDPETGQRILKQQRRIGRASIIGSPSLGRSRLIF